MKRVASRKKVTMDRRARKVYELEKKLIRQFFPGLRPRPIKLMPHKSFEVHGMADEPYLKIVDYLVGPGFENELEQVLKHELIHYELKDAGKHYHGHGKAFLRRAKQLGIVDDYVIERCASLEEVKSTPHRRKLVRTPIRQYAKKIESVMKEIEEIMERVKRRKGTFSVDDVIRFYQMTPTLDIMRKVYSNARKKGETHVTEEVWTRRRGSRGKSLEDMHKEIKALRREEEKLRKRQVSVGLTPKQQKRLIAIVGQQMKLSEKAERDYGVELY